MTTNAREIKFRGMCISRAWYFGYLSVLTHKVNQVEAGSYISNKAGMPFAYQVRPETVGQFTGLKDKSGKEIYEGDILALSEPEIKGKQTQFGQCVVKFGEYDTRDVESGDLSIGWYVEGYHGYKRIDGCIDRYSKLDSLLTCQGSRWDTAWEVIGNVWENPELLKEAR